MINKAMEGLTKDLERRLALLFEREKRIVAAYLFGSMADGTPHRRSDLDIGVIVDQEYTLDEEIELEIKIEEILGHDRFDLVIVNKAPLVLQFRTILPHRLIYIGDDKKRCEIEERIFSKYYDFLPRLKEFNREYLESLREKYAK